MAFELSFHQIRSDCPTEQLEALSDMARFTFAETFQHYQKSDLDDYLKNHLSVDALGREIRDQANFFYFVCLNDIRVGFIKWIYPSTKYLEHVSLDASSPMLLERFYFIPEYCGRGLAAVALEFVTSFAKYEAKADCLYLSVWEKNYRAQSFYQKHGFRTLGSFDYPVGQEIDLEFLYAKRLTSPSPRPPDKQLTDTPDDGAMKQQNESIKEENEETTADKATEERRQEARVKSQVKRTVPATLEDEAYGAITSHLYIVDISENGMRINLDRSMEPGDLLKITLPLPSLGVELESEFQADCKVIWSKTLAGGTSVVGLEFQDLAEGHRKAARSLINHWGIRDALDLVNLPTPVDTKIRLSEEDPWSPSVGARGLSLKGFHYQARQARETGDKVQVRLLLEAGTIETWAQVIWCEKIPNDNFDIGCEFEELRSGAEGYITLHLRRCRHRPILKGN